MKLAEKLHFEYLQYKQDCSLVTAVDAKYAPYLFNALASIHTKFPDHPHVFIYDIGLNTLQRLELESIPWVSVLEVPVFAPHWKVNWSWKPYVLANAPGRYVFYFDAANIVLNRSIELWFLSIIRNGYFVINNGQNLMDITPSDFWSCFNLDPDSFSRLPTFGAGLIGFDKRSVVGAAIDKVLDMTLSGYNLGRSANEKNKIYQPNLIRDCICFRADQTLLNLAFREALGWEMIVRPEKRYVGMGGAFDHPNQYLWYARRKKSSLVYVNRKLGESFFVFVFNRFCWKMVMLLISVLKSARCLLFCLEKMKVFKL